MNDYDSDDSNSDVSELTYSICFYDSDDTFESDSVDSDKLLWPTPDHSDFNDDENSFDTREINSNIPKITESK